MSKSIYEQLVQQTVRGVLFCEDPKDNEFNLKAFGTATTIIRTETKEKTALGIPKDSLLHFLIRSGNEDPALDENNNGDAFDRSWVMDCATWTVEQLRREKRTLKCYLNAQRQNLPHNYGETLGDNLILFEAYALIKLFLLEKDLDYRQCMQQSIGCEDTFITLIQVLLTLYARYFERVNGRQVLLCNFQTCIHVTTELCTLQISEKTDIKPIETLYDFFLTHHVK
ncbi:hypothetical protein P3T76_004491 [Phytophthora citrophthora]|uniref:Uncharacterized protein n=1 Tax=Phytophthora citrophthora TaxID=4793 RepID=A0AAD9GT10_9STRA|nr:hypothetical protein P3T76_004491 [Phytophthora citrophthora]